MSRILLKFKDQCYQLTNKDHIFEGMSAIDPDLCKQYSSRSSLAKDEWYYLSSIKEKGYYDDILTDKDSVMYPRLDRQKLSDCKFILDYHEDCLCVQNVNRYRIMKKRTIGSSGKIETSETKLVINDEPEYIYDSVSDRLYFKSLSAVKSLLPGIIEEFREATEDEVSSFVKTMGIDLIDGYKEDDIKIRNRKLIAIVSDKISNLSDGMKAELLDYVQSYCPQYVVGSKLTVRSDKEFNELLYALDERFYTTPVTKQKRKALTVDSDEGRQ